MHGFFFSMGGFMLYDNDVPIRILGLEELEQLESEGSRSIGQLSQRKRLTTRAKEILFRKNLLYSKLHGSLSNASPDVSLN